MPPSDIASKRNNNLIVPTDQPATTMTPSRRLRTLLALVLLIGNLLLNALSGYSLFKSRQHYEQRAATQTQNIASALDQSIANSIEKLDYALKSIADELERSLTRPGTRHAELSRYMSRNAQRMPEIESLRASDDRGWVLLGNQVDLSKPISIADRDYFLHHKKYADDQLFITEPLLGRISQHHVIILSRRLSHPDGRFAGVVYATIALEHFTQLLSKFDIGAHGTIALRDHKLGLVTRMPTIADQPAGKIGNRLLSPEFQTALNSGQRNITFHTLKSSDGEERTVTVRKMDSSPMYTIVGVASADYLSERWTEVYKTSAMVFCFALLSLVSAIALLRLIRDADKREGQIRDLAFYDPLTGLPSLRLGEDRLDMTLNQARRQGLMAGVMFMDLDLFKDINDLYGHDAGDHVLKTIAFRLTQTIRAVDTVARIGGDEFLVIFGTLADRKVAADVAQKIVDAVHEPIVFNDAVLNMGCSIGISIFPDDALDAQGLRRCADAAMYHVKRGGKNSFAFYESEFAESIFSNSQTGT